MDEDTTWYGARPRVSTREKVGASVPLSLGELGLHLTQCRPGRGLAPFRPMFIVAKRSPTSATAELFCFYTVHIVLEYGPIPNVMVALPNIGGALCSMPQSLADAHNLTEVQ